MDYITALGILGLKTGCSFLEVKKAYLNACKLYHPDNTGNNMYINQYNMCQEAFDYLSLNQAYFQPKVSSPVTANKVISSKGSYSYNHSSYVKKQAQYKKKSEEKKIRELKDIIEKSKQIKDNNKVPLEKVNYKTEDDILNQIRWIRVAKIIHDTIEADKLKKNDSDN